MTRLASLAAALMLGTAAPALALDLTSMTDAEREAFRAEVRAYLMENPQVIMEAVQVLEERQAADKAQADKTLVEVNADAIFDDGFSWVGGNPDGDVTIVEFMDYRCGYCRKAFDEVNALLSEDGNIRFVVKEFPILGEASVVASRFAIATKQVAGDEAYHAVHDALMTFGGQPDETSLTRLAESLGIDPAPILDAMNNPEVTEEIAKTRALAQRLQISGTPTFVIGSEMVRGYVPGEVMAQVVADARSE
ncbi:DSBA oxidoreductase [Oceanicola sp. 22II-s10i]|uniref:DsbA family protein n=1 Tax=Oceanicola sp. 22II-s10i TaxID=1317116 RepID=UPI000B523124|nr:DsbA family protein [Oceanicola sp. 22II-s10i]OWU83401.1 DSBA oxidoreductase [Oceanicola sp. 22II-s10i]